MHDLYDAKDGSAAIGEMDSSILPVLTAWIKVPCVGLQKNPNSHIFNIIY